MYKIEIEFIKPKKLSNNRYVSNEILLNITEMHEDKYDIIFTNKFGTRMCYPRRNILVYRIIEED